MNENVNINVKNFFTIKNDLFLNINIIKDDLEIDLKGPDCPNQNPIS